MDRATDEDEDSAAPCLVRIVAVIVRMAVPFEVMAVPIDGDLLEEEESEQPDEHDRA